MRADDAAPTALTTNETVEVRQKLQAFEKGKITLEELTEKGGAEWGMKLIAYYVSHTNDVTVKMKLPISRSFAAFEKYSDAAKVAADYVQVYSNDWHGWKILGVANFSVGNLDQALEACTNAVRLGDDGSYGPLAFVALQLDRLDIMRDIVPRLLVLKRSKPTREINPLDIVAALMLYSLKAEKKEIFVEALDEVDIKDILSRDDLKQLVVDGCKKFRAREVEKLCRELRAKDPNNSVEKR